MKSLNSEEWGAIYNLSQVKNIIYAIENEKYRTWTRELLKLTETNAKIMEIGCGSGETSLALSINQRKVTAVDYSEESIKLVEYLNNYFEQDIIIKKLDATKSMPFEKNEFDLIFQAGLLEHFEQEERIELLKNWSEYGKKMVSLIPNAASIPYRVGMELMKKNGTWKYGKELPQYTMIPEFRDAGLSVIAEYSIGLYDAIEFLPENHYLRIAFEKLNLENPCDDICGNGYLLVTIGEKK
ncbi:class I SAM-dependent methyltransferase [Lysinibacillus irui]|uniref:Methyltransferase domain-containing protein n=1 Tax=Lysinibacillus irui TaxID=2998077 RepID=A0AAJ5UVT6_9BACI|nr:class I SAM-dependent methyltransferase [Lysinibacillus irui]WDV07467.1 methyltransferase domain-containing protein [Lysinibacillus irui]